MFKSKRTQEGRKLAVFVRQGETMTMRRKIAVGVVLAFLVSMALLIVAALRHGFSAREEPTRLEAFLARHARKIATPSGARQLRNQYASTPEVLAEARDHFAEHCALCHGNDGRGNTVIGRNLYPKAPDMSDHETQRLSDGELYYIISNGVRFTGMPAWGGEDTPDEMWKLVVFIRHLPRITPEELKAMETSKHDEHEEAMDPGTAPTGGPAEANPKQTHKH